MYCKCSSQNPRHKSDLGMQVRLIKEERVAINSHQSLEVCENMLGSYDSIKPGFRKIVKGSRNRTIQAGSGLLLIG